MKELPAGDNKGRLLGARETGKSRSRRDVFESSCNSSPCRRKVVYVILSGDHNFTGEVQREIK